MTVRVAATGQLSMMAAASRGLRLFCLHGWKIEDGGSKVTAIPLDLPSSIFHRC
jgi:hypothetical protein